MSESERRRKYRYDRVLIDTERILDPQFDDAVIYLTGAQIEMMRNVTQYLNRPDTYVSEQFLGYYLTPTAEDYDSILAIVADMEESLMGNPNTIWGYKERWSERPVGTSVGGGSTIAETDPVPEGYVYVMEHWTIIQQDDTTRGVLLQVAGGSGVPTLYTVPNLPQFEFAYADSNITLMEGDTIKLTVNGLADTKICILTVWGHKMVVP